MVQTTFISRFIKTPSLLIVLIVDFVLFFLLKIDKKKFTIQLKKTLEFVYNSPIVWPKVNTDGIFPPIKKIKT